MKQVKDDGTAEKVHHGGQPRDGDNWRLGMDLGVTPDSRAQVQC